MPLGFRHFGTWLGLLIITGILSHALGPPALAQSSQLDGEWDDGDLGPGEYLDWSRAYHYMPYATLTDPEYYFSFNAGNALVAVRNETPFARKGTSKELRCRPEGGRPLDFFTVLVVMRENPLERLTRETLWSYRDVAEAAVRKVCPDTGAEFEVAAYFYFRDIFANGEQLKIGEIENSDYHQFLQAAQATFAFGDPDKGRWAYRSLELNNSLETFSPHIRGARPRTGTGQPQRRCKTSMIDYEIKKGRLPAGYTVADCLKPYYPAEGEYRFLDIAHFSIERRAEAGRQNEERRLHAGRDYERLRSATIAAIFGMMESLAGQCDPMAGPTILEVRGRANCQ